MTLKEDIQCTQFKERKVCIPEMHSVALRASRTSFKDPESAYTTNTRLYSS